MPLSIKVAARASLLSRAQVAEVEKLLHEHLDVNLEPIYTKAIGDIDLKTPLNIMAKTDFFTQNIDQLVLEGMADMAIHSAKDLPESLDPRLEIFAITLGVDPRDSLVSLKYTLKTLPNQAVIGVCSDRRIQAIKALRPDVITKSIRGAIDERLKMLEMGEYDALILAEAGLLRLKSDIQREILDIPTAPLQGQLAIVGLKKRLDLKDIFTPFDSR